MKLPIATLLLAGLIGLVLATMLGGWAARRGFPVPDESRRLGAIDGLRGYLALLVMVHHFSTYLLLSIEGGGWRDAPVAVLQSFGAGSVTLFFMITGALFFSKTWQGIGGNDWGAMYISRAFRILPLQIVLVAVVALIAAIRVNFHVGSTWITFPVRFVLWLTSYSQPTLFGYAQTAQINAFVLWSLWAEWKFYMLVLPAVALAMSLTGNRRARWLVPLALLASGIAFRYSGHEALQKINYAIFACGMIGLLTRSTRFAPLLRGTPAALVATSGVALSVAFAPVPDYPLPLACYTLFFTCVVVGNLFGGLLATKGALVLGEISFSIYMLHGVLLNLMFVDGARLISAMPAATRPWLLALAMPTMSAIAIATYLLVERPMIAVGRRIARRWGRPADAKTDASSIVAAP